MNAEDRQTLASNLCELNDLNNQLLKGRKIDDFGGQWKMHFLVARILLDVFPVEFYASKDKPKPIESTELPAPDFGNERWMTTIQFARKYPDFGTQYTVPDYCRKTPAALEYCCKREKGKYYVKPKSFFYFASTHGSTYFKNRAKKELKKLGIV